MTAIRDIIVVGCGVSGLTSAVRLLEAGFSVTILTRELPHETTSAVAAAVWLPYEAYPFERVLAWSRRSMEAFEALRHDPTSGVSFTTLVELYDHPVPDPWWRGAVPRFRRPTADELRPGYSDGFAAEVPLIETPRYLPYLVDRFRQGGGRIEVRPEGLTRFEEVAAPGRLIVNCTGLGARQLAGDPDVFPIRGQVVRVSNPGLARCLIEDYGPLAMTYVIPRAADCILGGTAEAGSWQREVDPAVTQAILHRARRLEPALDRADVLGAAVGLRPGRPAVRLEREDARAGTIIHNYGHGGAGFTLSWGCADEVLELVRR